MKVIKYISFLVTIFYFSANAQNSMTSSPYSMFGLGEVSSGLYGQNAGMGGVSYGMREGSLINTDNPAGLSGVDSIKLVAEASGFVKWENYKSSGNSNDAFTGNFAGFQMGGRIMPRWYMAAGISPYTSVGYYFSSVEPLEGTPGATVTSTYEGSGGISKVTFTNAFQVTPRLSFGVNASYVFGNMTQSEAQGSLSVNKKMSGQTFYADFGFQYQKPIARDISLTLGAVYGYKQKLTLENTTTIRTSSSEDEVTKRNVTQYLPQFFGIGGALNYKRFVYALDYSFREYSAIKSGDNRITFEDIHEVRMGISYNPSTYGSDSYWKRVTYKAGLDLATPYLNISGKSGLGYRATVGMAFPVINGLINAAFFYDRLDLQSNAYQKKIIGFTVSYTLSERFFRVKL